MVLADGVDSEVGYFTVAVDAHQTIVSETEETVVGAYPKHAVAGFDDRADERVAKTFGLAIGAEGAAAVAQEPASIGAGPEAAIAAYGQTKDAVLMEGGRVVAIVHDEFGAIETHQAARCADPQIVVRRLREGLNGILGKAVLRLPDAARVAIGQRAQCGGRQAKGEREKD